MFCMTMLRVAKSGVISVDKLAAGAIILCVNRYKKVLRKRAQVGGSPGAILKSFAGVHMIKEG